MLTPLEVRQLRSFVAVAQEGQVTRAADKLFVAQPALSQLLTKLEAQVGTQLLERHPRGVRLTPAGKAFLEKARIATAAVEDAENEAAALARSARVSVAWGFIGAPPMIAVPDLFTAFARARPDVDIVFRQLPWPQSSTATWLGPVDVALCYAPTAHPAIETFTVREDPRIAVIPADHALSDRAELRLEDVLDETFCGLAPSLEPVHAGFWSLDDHRGARARVSTDEAGSPDEVLACVATGRAVTTFAAPEAERLLIGADCVRKIPIDGAQPAPLALVWRRHGKSEVVRELAGLAAKSPNGASPEQPPG